VDHVSITKRLLALLAGGSAVGAGVAGAAVTTQDATAPDPVEVGGGGTSLDIEGDQVRVQAEASPLDDLLDSANTAGSPDTPGTEDVDTAGTESNSANTNSPNTNSPDTSNSASADTATGDSPHTDDSPESPDTADSPDNSGPGSFSSGSGSGGEDNSGSGSGGEDNSGSGSSGGDSSGSGSG
jgi:hypothetical protein